MDLNISVPISSLENGRKEWDATLSELAKVADESLELGHNSINKPEKYIGIEKGPASIDQSNNNDKLMQYTTHSLEQASKIHRNLTQFSVLNSMLTSCGNTLNSFLKGQ